MDKSQSLFLAAVVLGSQKPNPPKVLRSSLYPIFEDRDRIQAQQPTVDSLSFPPVDIETIEVSQVTLDFMELRNTQIRYDDYNSSDLVSSQIQVDEIKLRTTQLKYISPVDENLAATQISLDAITLQRTLVKYVELEQHSIEASQISVTNITLT